MQNKKTQIVILALTVIGLLAIVIGSSFAIFTTSVESTKTQIISAGILKLVLTEPTPGINLSEVEVMDNATGLAQSTYYDFTVQNTGDANATYKVYLLDDTAKIALYTGDLLDDKYVKLGLEVNGIEKGPLNLETVNRLINQGTIMKNQTINFRLRLWLDEDEVGTNDLTDQTIFLKIKVVGEQFFGEIEPEETDPACFVYTTNATSATITEYKCGYLAATYVMDEIVDIVIPNQLGGKNVTTIGSYAFAYNMIKTLKLPSTLTTIDTYAFAQNSVELKKLVIPANVTSIGTGAFNSSKLSSLILENGIKTIGSKAFEDNWLKSVTIPNSVTTIGITAFKDNQLTSVVLGTGVTTLSVSAFSKTATSNPGLTTIINATGRTFNWGNVINGSAGYSFVTGTVVNAAGNVVISAS